MYQVFSGEGQVEGLLLAMLSQEVSLEVAVSTSANLYSILSLYLMEEITPAQQPTVWEDRHLLVEQALAECL